jgi:hypothetical protein
MFRFSTPFRVGGAFFQVASQFNMLEMVSPASRLTMDRRYEHDHTQGPRAPSRAEPEPSTATTWCPLMTRSVSRRSVSSTGLPISSALGVDLKVRNGYAIPTVAQLGQLSDILRRRRADRDAHGRASHRLQWDTEVTLDDVAHTVTQAYCSALPVAYAGYPAQQWESFARLVLGAAYEASFAAAVLNAEATGNPTAYLTLLGAGAFGNPTAWVFDALRRASRLSSYADLDVVIVSYGRANPQLSELLEPARSWADHPFARQAPRRPHRPHDALAHG